MRIVVMALVALVAACGDRDGARGRPGLQDHGAHHGGVVFNGPRINIETTAARDGTIRVWLTNEWRQPLPLQDVRGTATVNGSAVALAADGDALVGRGPALDGDTVGVDVAVGASGGEPQRMTFVVPLADDAPGAAGVPLNGCVPPPDGPGPRPRCVLHFLQAVHGIVAARDGTSAVVSVLESRTTSWRLPAMTLLAGFDAAPPEEIPVDAHPHVEEPTSMAMRTDGREVVLALGEHLFRHEVATGRLVKELGGPGAAPRNVAWSPDGTRLLVNVFASGRVFLLDADSGSTVRTLEAPGETTAIGFSPDGSLAAVGTEAGPVVLFDVASGAIARTLAEPTDRTDALGFAGPLLVASGAEGILRVWDPTTGTLVSSTAAGVPLVRLAVRPDGTAAATGDREGHVRLHRLPEGTVTETIGWHRGLVRGIAWTGTTLLAGDADRQLAVWDRT
jgi:hypothetical protein